MKITHYETYEPLAIAQRNKEIQKAHIQAVKKSITLYIQQLAIITLILSPLLAIALYQF